jgi:hypothetical protein
VRPRPVAFGHLSSAVERALQTRWDSVGKRGPPARPLGALCKLTKGPFYGAALYAAAGLVLQTASSASLSVRWLP